MTIALRVVLALTGIVIVALGLNMAVGGFQTLGLQGQTDFVTVLNDTAYAVQDNHVRFNSGFFLASGLVFLAGAVFLERLAAPIITLCVMITIAGPFRLTGGEMSSTALSAGAMPSFVLELVLFPLVAFWVYRSTR